VLGGAATLPLAANAQQPAKLPTIGFFSAGSAAALGHWVAALVQLAACAIKRLADYGLGRVYPRSQPSKTLMNANQLTPAMSPANNKISPPDIYPSPRAIPPRACLSLLSLCHSQAVGPLNWRVKPHAFFNLCPLCHRGAGCSEGLSAACLFAHVTDARPRLDLASVTQRRS